MTGMISRTDAWGVCCGIRKAPPPGRRERFAVMP
jgi:hypothetical protein